MDMRIAASCAALRRQTLRKTAAFLFLTGARPRFALKTADVAEHPKVSNNVGLLANGIPANAGDPLFSLPTRKASHKKGVPDKKL
jgi:hypothetical protein